MSVADVDICNRALLAIGSRVKIAALIEDTEEAQACNMLYAQLRDQILMMAPWNFARKTATLILVKAAPGVPGSGVTNATQWISSYPAPPWAYEYVYPSDCLQIRYIVPQPGLYTSGVPIFSTPQYTYSGDIGSLPQQFIVTTDIVGQVVTITGITRANPAVLTTTAQSFAAGQQIYVTGVIGMTEINSQIYTLASAATTTLTLSGINSSSYTAYFSGGFAVNQTIGLVQQTVILTNAMGALAIYTQQVTNLDLWSPLAIQALVSALAGHIAPALTGDMGITRLQLNLANTHILAARVSDGNAGLTIQNSLPDWIILRGGDTSSFSSVQISAAYPQLFAVS